MSAQFPKRVLVIGLDGATWTLLKPWAKAGLLPNLARLMAEGTYGVLESVLPAVSPAAWASFMTGVNPGKHGVYDFFKREPGSYRLRVVRADELAYPTLWRLLSEKGRAVGVVNVPMTYPPEQVQGFLISGLGTPESRPFATPVALYEELRRKGYRVNKSVAYRPGQEAVFWAEVQEITELQAGTALELMDSKPWDFFMFVFRDTDEMAHFFWRFIDETHPAYEPEAARQWGHLISQYYSIVDEWIGRMVEHAGPETAVFIMSDHGTGPLYKDVFLNVWLKQAGFQAWREPPFIRRQMRRWGLTRESVSGLLRRLGLTPLESWLKERLKDKVALVPRSERPDLREAVDWSRTRAYSFGYHGQIYLNVRGREPEGIVEPGEEYERVRDELLRNLVAWRDPQDQQPVVTKVFKREDVYWGARIGDAPDIIVIMRDFAYITRQGYEFGSDEDAVFASPLTYESGSHRLEGVIIAWGVGIRNKKQTEAVSIMDLPPTILYLLQEPIPAWMDGRLLDGWINPELLARYPPRWEHQEIAQSSASRLEESWSEKDEREIIERLRGLGYLG